MAQNLSPIDAYPVERRMREYVTINISAHHQRNDNPKNPHIIPTQFLREEVIHPC